MQFGDVAPAVLGRHQGVAGHQDRHERREAERTGDKRQVPLERQCGDRCGCAELDRGQQAAVAFGRLGVTAVPSLIDKRGHLFEAARYPCWTQILPVLDLLDVATVDVPELGRTSVVAPVPIRKFDSIRQVVESTTRCPNCDRVRREV